ncbi:MAG: hypothetical protein KDC27_18805 [Acidobacteria bacterium]|nr:hypothetical protein [Acidobacteriota bacterium]
MTIRIELSTPEEEAAFKAQAAAEGLTVEDWLKKIGRERLDAVRVEPTEPKRSLAQLLRESPLLGADLNLDRPKDYPRPVEIE